jgi:hypothetical protein
VIVAVESNFVLEMFHEAGVEVVRRSEVNSFETGEYIVVLAPMYLKIVYELFSPFSQSVYDSLNEKLTQAGTQYRERAPTREHA